MINRGNYPTGPDKETGRFQDKPALTPAVLDGAERSVFTIRSVKEVSVADRFKREGKRQQVIVQVEEYPDNTWWWNNGDVNTACDAYGMDETRWIGQRVPAVVVMSFDPQEQIDKPMLHLPPVGTWQAHFDEFDQAMAVSRGKVGGGRRR
jgi:hypothetical protein